MLGLDLVELVAFPLPICMLSMLTILPSINTHCFPSRGELDTSDKTMHSHQRPKYFPFLSLFHPIPPYPGLPY